MMSTLLPLLFLRFTEKPSPCAAFSPSTAAAAGTVAATAKITSIVPTSSFTPPASTTNVLNRPKSKTTRQFPMFFVINDPELISSDNDGDIHDMYNEEDWIPDRQRLARGPLKSAAAYPSDLISRSNGDEDREVERSSSSVSSFSASSTSTKQKQREYPLVYTQEEEDLIASLGGKGSATNNQRNNNENKSYREDGYLGDSTLHEIAHDYSIPLCYLADVLASWNCPLPIDPNSRLGDLVTAEQAFAILEAIHTLDVASLHDRYGEDNLMDLCENYGINLKEGFEFAVRRGWSLPFGVRTFLRVEQEDELLEALAEDRIY